MTDSISPRDLQRLLEREANIRVFDVRLEEDRADVPYPIRDAIWRNPRQVDEWSHDIDETEQVIVYCVHGHHVSQSTRDALRRRNIDAKIIEGGIEAWCKHIERLSN